MDKLTSLAENQNKFPVDTLGQKKKVFDWRNPTDPRYPADPRFF